MKSHKDELMCTHSPISTNVTLRGGVSAGNFSNLGDVESMHMCTALCCAKPTCDLAFMIGETCVAVECASEEMCQTIRARPTLFNPKISYIRRREINQNVKKGILRLHMTSFPVIGRHFGYMILHNTLAVYSEIVVLRIMDVSFKTCNSIGSEIKNRCFLAMVTICVWKIDQDGVYCKRSTV